MRFFQGVTALGLVAAITLVIILTELTIPDLFACVLAFIATGWGILCVRFCDTEKIKLYVVLITVKIQFSLSYL